MVLINVPPVWLGPVRRGVGVPDAGGGGGAPAALKAATCMTQAPLRGAVAL